MIKIYKKEVEFRYKNRGLAKKDIKNGVFC